MDILEKKENQKFSVTPSDLIYLNADVGSVFDSQVANLLTAISKFNTFKSIILVCGVKSNHEKIRAQRALINSGVTLVFFKAYPNYPIFNLLQQGEIYRALKRAKTGENHQIHIRGELLASNALPAIIKLFGNTNKVLVDIRGAGIEELSIYQAATGWKLFLKNWNYRLAFRKLKNFIKISVVSPSLKEYLIEKTSIEPERIYINPCLAGKNFRFNEESRAKTRHELGLNVSDKLFIFSSGGSAGWQNTNEIGNLISDKYLILNLSKTEIDKKGVLNHFVSYSKVHDYLNAADAAIIFREANIVNKVACPVKFCEYVSCGLPVISNHAVDEIKNYISQNKAGIILNQPSDIHNIDLENLIKEDRISQSETALSKYGEEQVVAKYLDIYFN
ncbi:MAG: hypothetical protein R2850_08395 [Bacteroidia bacterium]